MAVVQLPFQLCNMLHVWLPHAQLCRVFSYTALPSVGTRCHFPMYNGSAPRPEPPGCQPPFLTPTYSHQGNAPTLFRPRLACTRRAGTRMSDEQRLHESDRAHWESQLMAQRAELESAWASRLDETRHALEAALEEATARAASERAALEKGLASERQALERQAAKRLEEAMQEAARGAEESRAKWAAERAAAEESWANRMAEQEAKFRRKMGGYSSRKVVGSQRSPDGRLAAPVRLESIVISSLPTPACLLSVVRESLYPA